MKNLDLIARIKHGLSRRKDASTRLRTKILLGLLRIDLQKQTEVNYLGFGLNPVRTLSASVVTQGIELSFNEANPVDFIHHSFARRYQISTENLLVDSEKSLIFNAEGKFLSESSEWPAEQVLLYNNKPPKPPFETIKCGRLGLSNSGYYHWLTEDLPSFLVNDSTQPILEFLGSNKRNREVYEILGFQTLTVPKWVLVQNLSFTTRGRDLGYLHPENLKVLRSFAAAHVNKAPKVERKLYISRSKSRRSLPDEESLERFLDSHGYEVIFAEHFSFMDQVKLFSEATSIIAPHGAGLTNALWSNKVQVLEIDTAKKVNRCFEWQSKVCGHEYSRYALQNSNLEGLFKFLRNWMH
jgi:hypothetical protein